MPKRSTKTPRYSGTRDELQASAARVLGSSIGSSKIAADDKLSRGRKPPSSEKKNFRPRHLEHDDEEEEEAAEVEPEAPMGNAFIKPCFCSFAFFNQR